MNRVLAFAALLLITNSAVFAQDPILPQCGSKPWGSNVTVTGHSRAWQAATFSTVPYGHAVHDARVSDENSERLAAPGAITGIHDLSWAGSQATDSAPSSWIHALIVMLFDSWIPKDYFWTHVLDMPRFLRDPLAHLFASQQLGVADVLNASGSGNNWQRQIAKCYSRGDVYQAGENIILNIGGNDLLNFYGKKHVYLGEYLWVRYILNPGQWLRLVVDRRQIDRELEWFWMWNMLVNNQRIALAVASIGDYHLRDFSAPGGDHVGRYSKLLLVEEAPSLASLVVPTAGAEPAFRLLLYFGDLDGRLFLYTFPYLATKHGPTRVAYLPMYFTYLNNMLTNPVHVGPGSWYILDFTHFTEKGIFQYGRMCVAKMIDMGWIARNPALNGVDLTPIYNGQVPAPVGGPGGGGEPGGGPVCDLLCLIILCFYFGICGG